MNKRERRSIMVMLLIALIGLLGIVKAQEAVEGADLLVAMFAFTFIWLIIIFFLLIFIGLYIYSSLAFMKLAERTKKKPKWLAWVPIVGKPLLASKIAKMHWWAILLLIGICIPLLNILCIIGFLVFYFIWMWKVFEAVGRPGWWILLSLIPSVGGIIFYVLLGVAAWGDPKGKSKPKKSRKTR